MTHDSPPPGGRWHFGDFELDVANARLWCAGAEVSLTPKSFALLAYLAQRPGELVLKDTLLDTVWGRRFVSEGAVKTVVSELRAALGDDARAPRWIETVQRRGYRFLGAVEVVAAAAKAAPEPTAALAAPPAGHDTPAPARRGNLPSGLAPLVARGRDVHAVDSLLGSGRVVTVCGPAGVGKTSLALAVAARRQPLYEAGAWLAELAPLPAGATDMAALRATLALALQIPPQGLPDNAALVRALQGQALLLVVDNAEHLLEELAPLVAQLQAQLPLMHCLVTSREPLQIPNEQVLRLAPLDLPAAEPAEAGGPADPLEESGAVQLFVQRVAARLPGFAPSGAQRRAVLQVCRALDGLPLALELAAARVPVLGVHGLAEHLAGEEAGGARLQLLTHASRTAQPHQRTLRAALDWSHALLKPAEQTVFRRLAVFTGGFTLDAAQQVCGDDELDTWAVLDALGALTEKSMVNTPLHDGGESRFTLLESLREYATEKLQAAGETETTRRAHLRVTQAYWVHADADALGAPNLPWTTRHAPELDNLRTAIRWALARADAQDADGITRDVLALVGHSAIYMQRAGLILELGAWCLATLGRATDHPDPLLRAGVQLATAHVCRFRPLLPAAEGLRLAQEAAAAYAQAGDALRESFAQYLCWTLALELGEHIERSAFVARMQALMQPGWTALERRYARNAWAMEERLAGRHQAFLECSREELGKFRQMGAQAETWSSGVGVMWAEHDQGCPGNALALGRALVDEIRHAGKLRNYAQLFTVYTTMVAESGDTAATRGLLAEALPMLPMLSACEILHLAMAWLAVHEGRHHSAARLLGWFDSPRRGGGVYGERTFTRRTAIAMQERLDAQLGAELCRTQQAGARNLGDDEAMRVGMALADEPGLRTDEKPTAS